MTTHTSSPEAVSPRVRIPADVERQDRVLAGLTARQVGILAAAALAIFLGYQATKALLPLTVFLTGAAILAGAAFALAVGTRDGVGLDQWAASAVRHLTTPRRLVAAPEGVAVPPSWVEADVGPLPAPLRLPAEAISAYGVIDLGAEGMAAAAEATTVSFALRTPAEQRALVAAFGRWLNSLHQPAQILVRAEHVDLEPMITRLREQAVRLPHPALETAAREHARFLAELTQHRDLLRRRVLVVLREPYPAGTRRDPQAAARAVRRRADEAVRLLAAAGIRAALLDAPAVAAALTRETNRNTPAQASSPVAAPDDIITAAARDMGESS